MSQEEIRQADAFTSSPKNVHRLAGGVATGLRNTPGIADWLPGVAPKRTPFVEAGADSVVEVEVLALRLEQQAGGWSLGGMASARVVRVADGKHLHTFRVEHLAAAKKARPLRDWTAPDSPLLRQELDSLVQNLTSQLAQQFLATVPPR